ncbi:hypothetical protein Q4I28_000250 [Leishmania naiffi]|uniref:Uncharacterized protein n=1 Tax=Leishmania naiffi TaxID=5678 RepID=A0AAW3CAT9_9TRYP
MDDDDIKDKDDEASLLKDHSVSVSSFSDVSEAYFNTTGTADLCCRDEAFARYVLNALVSVGLAMEEVDPAIARNTYVLANVRAAAGAGGVRWGEPCKALAATAWLSFLQSVRIYAPHSSQVRIRATSDRDINPLFIFLRQFCRSVSVVRQGVHDTHGTECFWCECSPSHVVTLFKA